MGEGCVNVPFKISRPARSDVSAVICEWGRRHSGRCSSGTADRTKRTLPAGVWRSPSQSSVTRAPRATTSYFGHSLGQLRGQRERLGSGRFQEESRLQRAMEAMARLHAGSLGRHRWTQSRASAAPRIKASRKLSSRRSAGSQRSPRGWATTASSTMTSARAGGRSESQRPARDEGLARLSMAEAKALAAVKVMSSGRSASERARVASEASLHASGSAMPRWASSGSSQNAASPSAAAVSKAAWPSRARREPGPCHAASRTIATPAGA
ncbi:MAG: hypothetical protein DMD83_24250 [Candidatus Rokuibacteriota bacterium]|nr:MAG: hypothetical protein DMD83_24250 [Candidatus Rokubacteria bacterium]